MGSWLGRTFGRGDRDPTPSEASAGAPPPPTLPPADRFAPGGEPHAYRVIHTAAGTDPRTAKRVFRSGVGVSFVSRAQAELEARQQAQRALEDALAAREPAMGGYGYHADRRLEPLVETIATPSGVVARITVNGYGAIVMNAMGAMFVDVDTNDEDRDPTDVAPPPSLLDLVSHRPELGFRTYRTLAGWRYLCLTRTFDPTSNDTLSVLQALGADEKYVLLCRLQRSFRARLTPKPWRAKQRPLTTSLDGIERAKLQRYIDKTWTYATARYVTSLGSTEISPDISPVIDYHDLWTQAAERKPLA